MLMSFSLLFISSYQGLIFASDIRVACNSAHFALPEVKRGLLPAIISLCKYFLKYYHSQYGITVIEYEIFFQLLFLFHFRF